jgi:large subunit ribosomal protein L31
VADFRDFPPRTEDSTRKGDKSSKVFGFLEKRRIFADQFRISMQKEIHPKNYRMVVFKDISCDYAFLTRSTVETKDTIKWTDGNEYPLVKLEISHMSHPFYTGKMKLVDTAGRIDKFRNRYKK